MIATKVETATTREARRLTSFLRLTTWCLGIALMIATIIVLSTDVLLRAPFWWVLVAAIGATGTALYIYTAVHLDEAVRDGIVALHQVAPLSDLDRRQLWRWALKHHHLTLREGARTEELVARAKEDIGLDVPDHEMAMALQVASFAWARQCLDRGGR